MNEQILYLASDNQLMTTIAISPIKPCIFSVFATPLWLLVYLGWKPRAYPEASAIPTAPVLSPLSDLIL